MSLLTTIEEKIKQTFPDAIVKIKDDSEKHRGHLGFIEGEVTHVRLSIISDKFEGIAYVGRHRMVNDVLERELSEGLHSLSLKLKTHIESGETKL